MTHGSANDSAPVFQRYMEPILRVLKGTSAPMQNNTLNHAVAREMGLSDEQLAQLHDPDKSDLPEAFYRMAWARTYLKKIGLLDNPRRGYWALTGRGRETQRLDADEVVRKVRAAYESDQVPTSLPEPVVEELLGIHAGVLKDGFPAGSALEACYARFRERFAPEILARLDGEQLLQTIHGRRTKDSLVYWLEFKDDEEFPGVFGSIAGGSALKFGIYQSTESGDWMTGHPRSQRQLTQREALDLVRDQRDQLVAGDRVLADFADEGEARDYATLQERLAQVAPTLASAAWGHKYFSLLYPQLLDDYHALEYQVYNLIRLHRLPYADRYRNAGLFVDMAAQLSIPVAHLTAVLNRRHGKPRAYWRLGLDDKIVGLSEWPRMRDEGFAAIGLSELGSLVGIERSAAGKGQVRQLVEQRATSSKGVVARVANQVFQFATAAELGDVIIAVEGGASVLGVGLIDGAYYYVAEDGPLAHRLPVQWLVREPWELPELEENQTGFGRIGRHHANLIQVERWLSAPDNGITFSPPPIIKPVRSVPPPRALKGVVARLESALLRKGQVILCGPPGTGKTYWAEQALRELAARSWYGASYVDLSEAQRDTLLASGAIETCCFHPTYGYEDFVVGYRPTTQGDTLSFALREGIFARLCRRALAAPQRHHYLLIDEINRGDIPRILGELLLVLEKDKRNKPISVPLMEQPFVVPSNVFVVGTMNTADRSVALLDAALRRRFAFIELMPDPKMLEGANVGGLPLGAWLVELNRRLLRHAGRDARNLQIGHSYFLQSGEPVRDVGRFAEILQDDIIPLLQEYCYEDFAALEQILGKALVHREQQRLNDRLFLPERQSELIAALLGSFDQITATAAAAAADDGQEEDALDEGADSAP